MRHVAFLLACLAFPCLAFTSVFAQEKAVATAEPSGDSKEIQKNAETFVDAFNKADAKTIAELFSEDGQMTMDGELIAEGRSSIEKLYSDFFESNPGTEICVTIDSIKQMNPNLAIEKGCSEMTSSDDPVQDAYTLVHIKQEGKWVIATANVTQCTGGVDFDWKEELSFLIGDWIVKIEDWSVETSFEWAQGGNFLKRSYQVKDRGEIVSSGIEVIGWDPVSERITSWDFGGDGGHGRGWWTREGFNWVIETVGTTAKGDTLESINFVTILGNDEFRWQSTNRTLNGASLPDAESVRVHRVVQKNANAIKAGEKKQ